MEDFADSFDEDGCAILEVECGKNKAKLYAARLCQGSKGSCILFRKSWLTPNEFQFVSGRQTAKDWKKSIRHHGKSLKLLLGKGVVKLHPNICESEQCGKTLPKRKTRMGTRQRAPLAENVELKETNHDEVDQNKGLNNADDDLKKENMRSDGEKDCPSGIDMQDTECSNHSEDASSESGDRSPADGMDTSFESKIQNTPPLSPSAHDPLTSDDSSQSGDHDIISALSKKGDVQTVKNDDMTTEESSDSKKDRTQNSEDVTEESNDSIESAAESNSQKDIHFADNASTLCVHEDVESNEKEHEINTKPDCQHMLSPQYGSVAVEQNKLDGSDVVSKDTHELDTISEEKHKTDDSFGESPSKSNDLLQSEDPKKHDNADLLDIPATEKENCNSETQYSSALCNVKPSFYIPIKDITAETAFHLPIMPEEDIATGSRSPGLEDSFCSKTHITDTRKYESDGVRVVKGSIHQPKAAACFSDIDSRVSSPAVTETTSALTHSSSYADASLSVKGETPQSNAVSDSDDRLDPTKVKISSTQEDVKTANKIDTKRKSRLSTVIENLRTSKEKAMASSWPTNHKDKHDRHSFSQSAANQTTCMERSLHSTEASRKTMDAASVYNHSPDQELHSSRNTPVSVSQKHSSSVHKHKASRDKDGVKRHKSRDKTSQSIKESAALPPQFPCYDNRSVEGSYLDLIQRYNMALAHQHYRDISSAYNFHQNLNGHSFPNGTTYEQFMLDPIMLYNHLVQQQMPWSIPNAYTSPKISENSTHKRGVKRSSHHSSSSSHSATRHSKTSSKPVNGHSIVSPTQNLPRQSEDAIDLSVKKRKT